jgi:dTDP-4-dehydrorhamnose reductase
MSNTKIAVTGANGQLGKELQELSADYPQYHFIFLSKEDFPIEQKEKVEAFFQAESPSFLINCAAYTAVDKAETDKENAFLINAQGVANLSSVCKKFDTKFIHISTDYVFDGESSVPYKEVDVVKPINVYGESKLKGEQLCMELNADSVIIRTAWVYSTFGNNFVKTMIRLMKERESISVVNDQIGSPTHGADLARAIMQIIHYPTWTAGIYHFSNSGRISWYDFAVAIRDSADLNCVINPIPSSQYPTPAKRPSFSLLDTKKIQETYKIKIRDWKEGLKECLQKLL